MPLRPLLPAFLLSSLLASTAHAEPLDLSNAVIVSPASFEGPSRKAVEVLAEEIEARSGLCLKVVHDWPKNHVPVIAVATSQTLADWPVPHAQKPESLPAEGFRIAALLEENALAIIGNDPRGVLFGVGRLLRELRCERGRITLPALFSTTSAPRQPLRGHQLGYRPKTNSYDAWDLPQWDRYIRDLALFGANAIELVPPRTDDDALSPHFPRPPLEMMVGMSRICDTYGLDVWIWFPVMDPIDVDPSKTDALLNEWHGVLHQLPRVDAVFVPGGDPGHIAPKPLFAFLEKATGVLHQSHPKAALWLSPQGFNAPLMDEFLALVKAEPPWLTGLVFGPQVRVNLPELRKAVPSRYPIRGYPDITHNRQCQHPVPDWDLAYAVTEGREAVNPRPFAQAALVKAYADDTLGFISYSEGCNDDVNKIIWSALGWDPAADVVDILRQYTRVFLNDPVPDRFAQALLALERNWSGSLLANTGVETTLAQLQDLERSATPELLRNWRFQQALYRAYYDAYLRDRLIHETALEARAKDALRQAPRLGSTLAMNRATAILQYALTEPASPDRRARVFELAEALFQSIRMQLSKPKYQAIDPERGANLDTIDTPLNNRLWLRSQFALIRTLPTEPERLEALHSILTRDDPGPGGFYDDLGDPGRSPHLVRDPSPTADPLFARAPFQGFALREEWPTAWRQYAHTFHDAPLLMRYDGLDPSARYTLRVTYAGDSPKARMRLVADGLVIHNLLPKPDPIRPVEFPIPPEATADGRLTLQWNQEPGRGGNGRGNQVAEVWLIRRSP